MSSDPGSAGSGAGPFGRLEAFIFGSSLRKLAVVLLAAGILKSGIWYFPNQDAYRQIAVNPFMNPFAEADSHYLMWNWLGPFIAWLLGASGFWLFFALHFLFAAAFTALFLTITVKRLSDRNARVAMVLYFLLPVSATSFFWVGMDGLTLLLMMAIFAFPGRRLLALTGGILLGLQHFPQAAVALGLLLVALFLDRRRRGQLKVTLSWCVVALAGVVIGKLGLVLLFRSTGLEVATDRAYWVGELFPVLIDQFWKNFQLMIWSVLGLGWLVLVKSLDGKRSLPFLLPFAGSLVLLFLVFDQTRVLAVVTFPLLLVFWLHNEELLGSIDNRSVGWLLMAWIFVPFIWVWGGIPQTSVIGYDVARLVGDLTGLVEVPTDALWPFWYEPPPGG
ncbi:MAG: hypothetical protein ACT4OM_09810 [Actinomycetota bacterium]